MQETWAGLVTLSGTSTQEFVWGAPPAQADEIAFAFADLVRMFDLDKV